MPTPIIGLTTRNTNIPKPNFPLISTPKSYTEALIRAGALPVLIPLNLPASQNRALLERLDGIIFTGGGDLHPDRYGGQPHPKVGNVDEQRDQFELDLFESARQAEIPFLGICRGFQTINVALGGTLYEDIADQHPGALTHDCYPDYPSSHIAHTVSITSGSLLANIVGSTELPVNSLHHQGVKNLAPELEPLAWAPDGLLEAYRLPDHPLFGLAVQWHPEWLPEAEPQQAIFSAFIQAAEAYQSRK